MGCGDRKEQKIGLGRAGRHLERENRREEGRWKNRKKGGGMERVG